MLSPSRRHQPALIRQLIATPQRFHFVQAVRILDRWLAPRGTTAGYTLEQVLRCRNSTTLAFPPGEIEALTIAADSPVDTDAALHSTHASGQLRRVFVTPAFMGFLGTHGVLPYCYTDAVAAQIHDDKNEAARAFLDTFSHRSMVLFYRAWQRCRIEYRVDTGGKDGFLPVQLALAGKVASPPTALPDSVAAHYAAVIRQRPVSAAAIAGVLREYFAVPVAVEPFVGAWETLAPHEQTSLGMAHCQLGMNTMAGPRYWSRLTCVRVRIGPLARADYDGFLPGGTAASALRELLALFCVPTLRFEIRLVLRAADVRPSTLGQPTSLGLATFLLTAPAAADRDDTQYFITF